MFADSFESAGELVTRIVMLAAVLVGAVLATAAVLKKRRSRERTGFQTAR